MRVLIAPLNWGLGHATRCIPIVRRYIESGAEVWLGGSGASLRLLHDYFPQLTTVELAPLDIRYSSGNSQVFAMLRAVPKLLHFTQCNHRKIKQLLRSTTFDLIISDNCFGVYTSSCDCVYITHQLHICLPKPWRWLEALASKCHSQLYKHYKEIWVPDYAGTPNLSGLLGHPEHIDSRVKYIGPLSRFDNYSPSKTDLFPSGYDVIAVLSGPEPQRTLFEQQIMSQYIGSSDQILIIRGLTDAPQTTIRHHNITLVSSIKQLGLRKQTNKGRNEQGYIPRLIVRSGYSTIMDLHILGLRMNQDLFAMTKFIPTPGQPEQEYLANYHTRYTD